MATSTARTGGYVLRRLVGGERAWVGGAPARAPAGWHGRCGGGGGCSEEGVPRDFGRAERGGESAGDRRAEAGRFEHAAGRTGCACLGGVARRSTAKAGRSNLLQTYGMAAGGHGARGWACGGGQGPVDEGTVRREMEAHRGSGRGRPGEGETFGGGARGTNSAGRSLEYHTVRTCCLAGAARGGSEKARGPAAASNLQRERCGFDFSHGDRSAPKELGGSRRGSRAGWRGDLGGRARGR